MCITTGGRLTWYFSPTDLCKSSMTLHDVCIRREKKFETIRFSIIFIWVGKTEVTNQSIICKP